jgi:hypothetical protein
MICDMPGCTQPVDGEALFCNVHKFDDRTAAMLEKAEKNLRARANNQLSWDENEERK